MSENERIPLRIVLKSGAEIHATVTDWSIRKHQTSQEILEFSWTDMEPRLAYINLDEIAAITRESTDETKAKTSAAGGDSQ